MNVLVEYFKEQLYIKLLEKIVTLKNKILFFKIEKGATLFQDCDSIFTLQSKISKNLEIFINTYLLKLHIN